MKIKIALFAVVGLFVACTTAFCPYPTVVDRRRTTALLIGSKIGQWLKRIFDDDVENAIEQYGGSSNRFGMDIDVTTAGYAGGDSLDGNRKNFRRKRRRIDDADFDPDLDSDEESSQTEEDKPRNRFALPEVANQPHSILMSWEDGPTGISKSGIEVVLVTQCSLDRLPNLRAQLSRWNGKASVAIYAKKSSKETSKNTAIDAILKYIEQARTPGNDALDVAVTLVEGCAKDEPYPINYLRNVALLEAQKQHLNLCKSLCQSAVLLVDVDFRPSSNLHSMLHTPSASVSLLEEDRIVVCPAFESITTDCPETVKGLKQLVDVGQAEGFHTSHFPSGHAPTNFEAYWEKSTSAPTTGTLQDLQDYFWKESYDISHQDLFEPYIAMASANVPLYDERFQGYGLNKISHLASVAASANGGKYRVLPGVFLVAPTHERSESWEKLYGKSGSRQNKHRQSILKELYSDFQKNLEEGRPPVVSTTTKARQEFVQENSDGIQ